MGRSRRHCALLVLIMTLLSGCSEENVTRPIITDSPEFLSSPDTLYILDSSPNATLFLSTDAPGTLNWRVTSKPSWITVSPDSGQVTQALTRVTVTASPANLAATTHGGTIVLHSSGGVASTYVLFSVQEHPSAAVSVTSLNIAAGESDARFTITNQGTGLLFWSLTSSQPWLLVGPTSSVLGQGQSANLYATVERGGLPVGTAQAEITITSNSDGGPITIPVSLEVPAAPELRTSPDSLRFNYFVDASSFKVWNSGNAPLTWSATASQGYLELSSNAGTVDPGDTTTITVNVDRTGLATGVYGAGIDVTSADLPARHIGVITKHFNETKWLLDETITDAEYDHVHDRIVAVGGTLAPKLLVIDPEARTYQSVTLPLPSTCVSIRPDGLYAAAGHNGSVSYVNLTTLAIQQTYGVTADALDVVLASNGWLYVFPRRDQWTEIRCINLTTGAETPHTGRSIYAGTVGKLHPSGDFIYGANNGLSPSDFEKYNIQPGTAAYMYDSPYHGDYAFSGDLWFSQDGLRIFARSGNVFRSSSIQNEDMTYTGSLTDAAPVQWVETSTAAGRVFALRADSFSSLAPSELRVYNSSFLAFLGVMPLPPFLVPDGSGGGTVTASSGRFAFVNAAGTRVHVLLKARPGTGLVNDWAVTSFNASALP